MKYDLDPTIPMDTDSMYLGAILRNHQWRFFYSHSYSWALDMRSFYVGNIPDNRKKHLYFSRDEFEEFLKTLDYELTAQDIHRQTGKLPLEVLIDYDNARIVDGTYNDEGLDLTDHIPSDWQVISRHPFNFLPYELLMLWMTHHYLWDTDLIGINDYCSLCAIKVNSQWYFFYGLDTFWLLDFQSFRQKIGVEEYLKHSNYECYREKLPYVDETNVNEYLNLLAQNFIPQEYLKRLVYLPSADWYSDNGFTALKKPDIRYIVDFDEHLLIKNVLKENQIKLEVDPSSVYLPMHWKCHYDKTINYLPEALNQIYSGH